MTESTISTAGLPRPAENTVTHAPQSETLAETWSEDATDAADLSPNVEQAGQDTLPHTEESPHIPSKAETPAQEKLQDESSVLKGPGDTPPKTPNNASPSVSKQTDEKPIKATTSWIDDEDDDVDLEKRLRYQIYNRSSRNVPKEQLEKRIKKANLRLLQQIDYSILVEDRVTALEARLKKIEGNDMDAGCGIDTFNEGEVKGKDESILGLNRVSFERCRPKTVGLERRRPLKDAYGVHADLETNDTSPRHLIDVVWGSPGTTDRIAGGPSSTEPASTSLHGIDPTSPTKKSTLNTPDRVRINSGQLLQTLTKITGQKFKATYYSNYTTVLKSQVILRPFKIFVVYEGAIRAYADRLAWKLKFSSPQQDDRLDYHHSDDSVSPMGQPISREEIEQVKEVEPLESKRCLQELQVLMDFMDNDLKSTFELRHRIEQGTLESIAFADLWHLFRPGDDIIGSDGNSQIYRVLDTTGGREPLTSLRIAKTANIVGSDVATSPAQEAELFHKVSFQIFCYYYHSDGERLGTVSANFEVKSYEDLKPLTALPLLPLQFARAKNAQLSRTEFVLRGRRYIELAKNKFNVVHKTYTGLFLATEQFKEEVDSEVIIDTAMAILKNPSLKEMYGIESRTEHPRQETTEFLDPECRREGCHENTAIQFDYDLHSELSSTVLKDWTSNWDPSRDGKEMHDDDYILCPNNVNGYVLRSRKWVSLDVNLVQDIKKYSGGFSSLVLPSGHKETLLALVETHSKIEESSTGHKPRERQIDLVRGKGKGLIILLHGEPGVGKTSTAECVAEHTRRPLFQVTCGDIGVSAEAVEKTLENHFQLAHKWGCVLLLDEADVFLMRRNRTDLKRNAIVSVFLRVLEYYSGILFLTTNRVGVFDQAFRSRIHMSFFYPKLDRDSTLKIWRMNLERTQKRLGDSMKITPQDHAEILRHAEDHYKELDILQTTWNGRQIRNAFQTAIALAEYDAHQAQIKYDLPECPKPALEVAQFEKVAEASKHFAEYLKQTAGLEADLAREARERADELNDDGIRESIAEQRRGAQRL